MGTRHHIIRALDKKHVDCLGIYQAFTEAHVQEIYDAFCASAISDLAKTDAQCYGLYFQSLFSVEDEALVNGWVQSTKEQFWKRVEERQKQTIPAERLSPKAFQRLKEMYQYEDTPLSLRNHPLCALAGCLLFSESLLKQGAVDLRFIPPALDDLSSPETAKTWLLTHYSQNIENIEAYLIANKKLNEPLYPLFLQGLEKEKRREISLRLWQAILEQLVTCHDPSLIYKDIILQALEEHFKKELADLSEWVHALPKDLKEAYFSQWLNGSLQSLRDFSLAFATTHNQWRAFPLSQPLVFNQQDLRGTNLSTLDLSNVTFNECDLRLTNILANPSVNLERLLSSQIEEDSLWIAAQNGYMPVINFYLDPCSGKFKRLYNLRDKSQNTPLMCAAKYGQAAVVKAILEADSSLNVINAREFSCYTALMYAAERGYAEVVQAILKANSSLEVINQRNFLGYTALMLAAENGHIEVVIALLEADSSLEVILKISFNDDIPRRLAFLNGHHEIKRLLDLYVALSGLEKHAKTIGEPYEGNILPLVKRLKQITLDFYKPNANAEHLKEAFTKTYQDLLPHTKEHREAWKPLLANIMIAASIIGLIAIGINYAVTGELGFFTKTKRRLLLDEITATAGPELCNTMVAG